ncbi:hypothetical protein ACFOHT_04685 [Massilia oculi]|uniref:2-isopropylmalate synthase LeuA allosteric (dimerisation) domain-containing protein n=1 Tax=Massilia oculi TaxID=945844 RepID=A0A2S2DDE4_9BURK|nr:hypothetical protein [Massilia oculi]AWL03372.1 hypothetical protein DIR46_02165 [Massilia oculi]
MNSIFASPVIEVIQALSLDQLWHEAESLGRIEVDHRIGGAAAYRVQIRFSRRSGTTVWAQGEDTNIAFAMAKAINEAREMGAGESK